MAFGVSKNILGFIQAFMDFEKKKRQVDFSRFAIGQKESRHARKKFYLLFFKFRLLIAVILMSNPNE